MIAWIVVWQHAKDNGFMLASQDSDFADMAAHYGHPPKVIWLRCGNQPVAAVEALLRRHANNIAEFDQDNTAACWKSSDSIRTYGLRSLPRRRQIRRWISSSAPTPGISGRTFLASCARCWPSPVVCRHTWQNARKAPNEGTRDSRSVEFRVSSSP